MSDDNAHANGLNAQLRQAEEDGDLPEWLAAKHDLDDEHDNDGEDDE